MNFNFTPNQTSFLWSNLFCKHLTQGYESAMETLTLKRIKFVGRMFVPRMSTVNRFAMLSMSPRMKRFLRIWNEIWFSKCVILYSPTFGTLSAAGWAKKDSWRGDPGANGGGGASQTGLGKMIRTRRKRKKTFRWPAIVLFESPNSGRTFLLFGIRDFCYHDIYKILYV